MKKSLSHKGFTLVEILVVILIISVLAGLGFGAFQRAILKGKETVASNDIKDIVTAVELFFNDYGYLPDVAGADDTTGALTDDGPNGIMTILLGREDTFNKKEKRYLGGGSQAGVTGLIEDANSGKFLDPWGGEYILFMDINQDDKLPEGDSTQIFTSEIYGRKVVVYSEGPDDTSNRNASKLAGTNRDNIYSW